MENTALNEVNKKFSEAENAIEMKLQKMYVLDDDIQYDVTRERCAATTHGSAANSHFPIFTKIAFQIKEFPFCIFIQYARWNPMATKCGTIETTADANRWWVRQ